MVKFYFLVLLNSIDLQIFRDSCPPPDLCAAPSAYHALLSAFTEHTTFLSCTQDDGAIWPTIEKGLVATVGGPDTSIQTDVGTSGEAGTGPSFADYLSCALLHLARAASRARWAQSWAKVRSCASIPCAFILHMPGSDASRQ